MLLRIICYVLLYKYREANQALTKIMKYTQAENYLREAGVPNVEKSITWIKNILGDGSKDEAVIRKSIFVLRCGEANPKTQKAFEMITGVKLPKSQKAAEEILNKMSGLSPLAKKWMTEKEVKDFIEANKGKKVCVDDLKSDWKRGRHVHIGNPVLNEIIGMEDNLVVYQRNGYEYSRPISAIRDFLVDGKSVIGDKESEEYFLKAY
jgi:hypothetical protein